MQFEDIKVNMQIVDTDYARSPGAVICTVVYVDENGFLIRFTYRDQISTQWRDASSAVYFEEHVNPIVDLDQEYWVSRDDGKVRARVDSSNRHSVVWPKTCHRIRITGYEVVE